MQYLGRGHPIAGFYVYGWTIAGNETTIGVKAGRQLFAFDIGIAPQWTKYATHVFISHGHIDHIGALCQHRRKQQLVNAPPCLYHLNPSLINHVQIMWQAFAEMHGPPVDPTTAPQLVSISPGSYYQLDQYWAVECFATDHTVQSQGYILSSKDNITGEYIPQIAYTGDTRFSIFTRPAHPSLLRVKLLICEATYLTEEPKILESAERNAHIALKDFCENADLFQNVGAIFLTHFSDRYSVDKIKELVYSRLPPQLAVKTYVSLMAKAAANLDQSMNPPS